MKMEITIPLSAMDDYPEFHEIVSNVRKTLAAAVVASGAKAAVKRDTVQIPGPAMVLSSTLAPMVYDLVDADDKPIGTFTVNFADNGAEESE